MEYAFAWRKWSKTLQMAMAGLIAVVAGLGSASAQNYPSRPVRVIVPYPAGSSSEIFGRVVSQKLSDIWKVPVVIETIAGAGGVVGTQAIAKSPADGYTLGWVASPHSINAAVYPSLPFDPIKDFRPIVSVANSPLVFLARPALQTDSMKGLAILAQGNPGKVNYASLGIGSVANLAIELFGTMANVKFTHIPYKNTGQLTTDLMGGQIDFAMLGVSAALPHIQAGRLKALGVTSAQRASVLPNVATVAEGFPGYEVKGWFGFIGPAGIPNNVVARVQTDAISVVKDPSLASTLAAQSLDIDIMESSEFARRIVEDIRIFRKIVVEAGIKVE